MKTYLNFSTLISSFVLEQKCFHRFFILFIALIGFSMPLQAQTFKTGDVVYFRIYKAQGDHYFKSSVYVIATVKGVIGSSAILDTEMYLYKCRAGDSDYKMGTTLEIAKRFGVGHTYETWRASQNKGYRRSLTELKKYNEKVEREITKGKIEDNVTSCMVLTD